MELLGVRGCVAMSKLAVMVPGPFMIAVVVWEAGPAIVIASV